jgi:hypothetical protein
MWTDIFQKLATIITALNVALYCRKEVVGLGETVSDCERRIFVEIEGNKLYCLVTEINVISFLSNTMIQG